MSATGHRRRGRSPLPDSLRRLGLALLLTGACSAAEPDLATNRPYDFQAALARREFEAARRLIDEERQASPDQPAAAVWSIQLVAAEGRLADALNEARDFRESHPNLLEAYLLEARILTQMARLKSAGELYQRCLEQFPTSTDARLGLAQTALWRGDLASAERLFQETLDRDAAAVSAFHGLLRVWIAQGHPARAWEQALTRERQQPEPDAETGLILAGVAARVGAFDRAEQLATRDTPDPDLRRRQVAFRARQQVIQGHHAEALALVDAWVNLDPPDYDALVLAADTYAAADRRMKAGEWYERARRLAPERPEAVLGLARLASREGRLAGSLAIYRQIVTENPESLEGWLGVIRTSTLLDDPTTGLDALAGARVIVPNSATLYDEELRLSLLAGDATRFESSLTQYLRDQPNDERAHLWARRWSALGSASVREAPATQPVDPLAPELAGINLRLRILDGLSPGALADSIAVLNDPELRTRATVAVSRQLAVLLQPEAAIRLAASADPDAVPGVQAEAEGWWAYASTPPAQVTVLRRNFDSQAVTVWMAGEIHRRFRQLYIETESQIWDEWLLVRARWFATERGQWGSPEAADRLAAGMNRLGAGWQAGLQPADVEQAWSAASDSLPGSTADYAARMTRARWCVYRNDPGGALEWLQSLQHDFPDAEEPWLSEAAVYRSSGRCAEAEHALRALARNDRPGTAVRLAYAAVLRQRGLPGEAEWQLRLLDEDAIEEPEVYLARAEFAECDGRSEAAWRWCQQGLERHPRAVVLRTYAARWLSHHQQPEQLARLLAGPNAPPMIEPRWLAIAWPWLNDRERETVLTSGAWWFTWRWLAWERIGPRAVQGAEDQLDRLAAAGKPVDALSLLRPAMQARIPDPELWLLAARLCEATDQSDAADEAIRYADQLGLCRLDATLLKLTQQVRSDPQGAVRELNRMIARQPEDRSIRLALVYAFLRAGQVGPANRALSPLVESDPSDPEVRLAAAQVNAAQGHVRQARSLQESLLRLNPLCPDSSAARRALSDADEWRAGVTYEYDFRRSRPQGDTLPAWQQGGFAGFWHQPESQTMSMAYEWYLREADLDQQVLGGYARKLGEDWILELNAGGGIDADYVPRWRGGVGVAYSLTETLVLTLGGAYLDFEGLQVWQAIPGVAWRWHPRGTLDARLFIAANHYDDATDSSPTVTAAVNAAWQLSEQSAVVLHAAVGGEDTLNPTLGVIGQSFQSYGIDLRLGWRHRWTVQPGYRYEIHENFTLQAATLGFSYAY